MNLRCLFHAYTIWFQDKDQEEAKMVDDEPLYFFKRNALRKAEKLAKQRCYRGCYILVRKIRFNSANCVEWSFDCDEYEEE